MTSREKYKIEIITKIINKEMRQGVAAKLLGISPRQIRRLKIAVLDNGENAVVHGLKGKRSNHRIQNAVKENTLKLIRELYSDFKPGFATEKLQEKHNLHITSRNRSGGGEE